jgi:NTE family protein
VAVTLAEWLDQGPFTLSLSAGFFGFFAHAGSLSALERAGRLPTRVTGASAGALVGGLWAGGVDAEVMERELLRLKREDFWDPAVGFGLLRGRLFRERVASLLVRTTFEAARTPAALSVWDVLTRKTVVLEQGDLSAAICASCAFPGMFQPVWVNGRPLLDGGIADRPGHHGLRERERVLFVHLASKSPWRKQAPKIPTRAAMVTVVARDLPRLGPFRLKRASEAFERARDAMTSALRSPIADVIEG